MRKNTAPNLDTFMDWTNGRNEDDNALVVIRFGKGHVKSTFMVYPAWKGLTVCKTRNMRYIRYGWIELNLPNKEAKDKLNHLRYSRLDSD